MADLTTLTARAMALRERFADLEKARGGRSWSKEEVMQGFVGDVGDLMKLVMAQQGLREIPDLDRKLAHELADCLWSILVLAQLYDIDLQEAFFTTMDEVEVKIAGQLASQPPPRSSDLS